MTTNSKINKIINNKVFWMAVSLLAAIVMWFYYTGTQDEQITIPFHNVEVVFTGADTLRESRGFVVTEVETQSVSVRISGARSAIGTLDSDDIKAVIDLSRVTRSGTNNFSYTLTYPTGVDGSQIREVSREPSNIMFVVSRLTTRTVPVRGAFVGSVAEGYVAEEPQFEPSTITLTGPDTELDNIEYVWATIGGDELTRSRSADVTYAYMDEDGNELPYNDITADYDTVLVTLTINVMKEVPLTVNLINGAGATSDNSIVTIEPSTITISGDSAIVDAINSISLGTIDLASFPLTYEDTLPIVLNNEVENVSGITEASVRIETRGLATRRLTLTNISCTNVPEGINAEPVTRSLEVVIRAAEDDINRISSDNLSAVVDLSDYESTGDLSVPARIYVNGFSNAGAIGDYRITVNLSK